MGSETRYIRGNIRGDTIMKLNVEFYGEYGDFIDVDWIIKQRIEFELEKIVNQKTTNDLDCIITKK